MGQIGDFLSQAGGSLLSGAQDVGGELMQGFQGLGQGIGGLFGGGGAVSPGTIGAAGAQVANAPSALDAGMDAVANVGAPAAAGAGQAASSIMSAPGIGVPAPYAGVDLSGAVPSVDMTGVPTGASADTILSGMNPQGALATSALSSMDPNSVLAQATGVPTGSVPQLTGAGGGGNFLQNLLKNPAQMKLLGEGGMLGAELLNANKTPAGEAQIKALAAQQGGFAKNQGELAQAEQQGLLPAGATNLFQGQLQAAEAAIRSKYAEMGMTGSSAEMQDLEAARTSIMGQMFQQGQQMAQSGWANVNQATGYESQLLNEILSSETAQGTALGQALAAFAGAAAK